MKKIEIYEPFFFLFFGAFHLHRVWGLVDRQNYADFWMGLMRSKGALYYLLMGALAALCILGIVTFIRNRRNNYWWRWIYVLGGSYLLFDLFAIATGLEFWEELLLKMFDVSAWYWNILWICFILLGGFAFGLGIRLLLLRRRVQRGNANWEEKP